MQLKQAVEKTKLNKSNGGSDRRFTGRKRPLPGAIGKARVTILSDPWSLAKCNKVLHMSTADQEAKKRKSEKAKKRL